MQNWTHPGEFSLSHERTTPNRTNPRILGIARANGQTPIFQLTQGKPNIKLQDLSLNILFVSSFLYSLTLPCPSAPMTSTSRTARSTTTRTRRRSATATSSASTTSTAARTMSGRRWQTTSMTSSPSASRGSGSTHQSTCGQVFNQSINLFSGLRM